MRPTCSLEKTSLFLPPPKKKVFNSLPKNFTQTSLPHRHLGIEKSCYLYAFLSIYLPISKLISLLTTLWVFTHRAGGKGCLRMGCGEKCQRRAERYHSAVTQRHSILILLLPFCRGCSGATAPRLVQAGRPASPFKAYPRAKSRRGEEGHLVS